jgi:hypothetical protein
MVNIIINMKYMQKALLLLTFIVAISSISYSSNGIKHVYISGQIINANSGSPIVGHLVYIESSTSKGGGLCGYFKSVKTNNDGYYYDTIATNEYKGSLVIYSANYYEEVVDTTVHFRFLDRASDVIMVDFLFFSPSQDKKLQAKFNYSKMQCADGYKYSFVDETLSENIISWQWDFGDGTTSTLQNPVHLYRNNGFFKITFTVTKIVDSIVTTSTISKQLYLYDRDYYHLGGHVFSEHFPVDMGYAYLYMIDSLDNYIVMDTVAFDTLGYYYFFHIPKGNYLVKAEPMIESQYYGTLLPTYFGDKLFWQDAETVTLNNTCWECNIHLKSSVGSSTGEGSIFGNVVFDNLPSSFLDFSVGGVNIYLFDDTNNLLTCSYSDDYGGFGFGPIELRTYWLYPEITGVQSERIMVELTPETPIINDVEIRVMDNGISSVLPNDAMQIGDVVGLPFPNPVSETLSMPLNLTPVNSITYDIFNVYGELIISGETRVLDGIFNVSISNIKNGSYIIRTNLNDKFYDRVFIVAR